jgi:L-threonylcarbamoyladenylate synthase
LRRGLVHNEFTVTSSSTWPIAGVTAAQIAGWLRSSATVILPTETVYGLAVQAGDPAAAGRVFELKGRPAEFNLPVVIGNVAQLDALGLDFNETARALAAQFWPGPLTIVMGFAADRARPSWLAGREEVAIRFPEPKLLRDIAIAAGPLLMTSSNRHGAGATHIAREAADNLNGYADYVVDGGTLSPIPSTIINARVSPARIERVGAVTAADLAEFIERKQIVVV